MMSGGGGGGGVCGRLGIPYTISLGKYIHCTVWYILGVHVFAL